jgi:hypothetical protein
MHKNEVYWLGYWKGEINALLRFTYRKDTSGSYAVNNEKEYKVLWMRDPDDEKHYIWYHHTLRADIFLGRELIHNEHDLFKRILEEKD